MLDRSKVYYQTPSMIVSLLLPILLIYPSLNQLHLSTTSLMQESSTVYNLYQDWKHLFWCLDSLSRIYCLIYGLFIKIQSRRRSLITLHSKNNHILEGGRRKLLVLSLHHLLQRLVLNLRSYLVVEEHYVSSIYLFTCLPAYLVSLYLDGVIIGR